jgi:lysosomal Pro-X carboxypeptidase
MNAKTIAEDLKYASNIVFSNGKIDPWSVGGILGDLNNPNLQTIIIEESAHHLDLRAPNEDDPQSVVDARKSHIQQIQKWLT